MRLVTWNLRRATETSKAWEILVNLKPDIALLQEVTSIPTNVKASYAIKFQKAISKTGEPQKFGTAIITRGKFAGDLLLSSNYSKVNQEIEYFKGNLVSSTVQLEGYPQLNVISVYGPAWPLDWFKLMDTDKVTELRRKGIKKFTLSSSSGSEIIEIILSILENVELKDSWWIVGGDLNIAGIGHTGKNDFDRDMANKGFLKQMEKLHFIECLSKYNGRTIPTFRNSMHQLDYLFVTNSLHSFLYYCFTGDNAIFGDNAILEQHISDHLPIIADFKNACKCQAKMHPL